MNKLSKLTKTYSVEKGKERKEKDKKERGRKKKEF